MLFEHLVPRTVTFITSAFAVAEGGDSADPCPQLAEGSLGRWLCELARDNAVLYALMVLGIMVGLGAVLGFFIEHLLTMSGRETKPMDNVE